LFSESATYTRWLERAYTPSGKFIRLAEHPGEYGGKKLLDMNPLCPKTREAWLPVGGAAGALSKRTTRWSKLSAAQSAASGPIETPATPANELAVP